MTESIVIMEARFQRVNATIPVHYAPVSGTLWVDSEGYRDCTYVDPYNPSNFCLESTYSAIAGEDEMGAAGEWVEFHTRAGRWYYDFISPPGTTFLTVMINDTCLGPSTPVYQEPYVLNFEADGRGRITRTATSFIWNINKTFTTVYIGAGGVCTNQLTGRLRGRLP